MSHKKGEKNKQWSRVEAKTTVRGSPIPGVQMLELHRLGNFPLVQQQLHAAMKAKYGPVADFIKGKPRYVPTMTDVERLDAAMSQEQVEMLQEKALTRYLDRVEKAEDDYVKIFGEIESICDTNLREKLERMDEYTDAAETQDTEALWNTIKSLVCDDGNDQNPAERKFRALSKYNNERMFNNESLSTFYNRFKLRYEACKTLGVAGFQDESEAVVRQFYAKLDGARYAALYRDKVNLVNRNIDNWPVTLLGAYADVERWIPPRATDATFNRPTAFAVAENTGAKSSKYPCHICGKTGHWKANCPDAKESSDEKEKGTKEVPEFQEKKTKKKLKSKSRKVHFANYTTEEVTDKYFEYCNYSFLTNAFRNHAGSKVPKGKFVFDTGADVHVCTDATLFTPAEPPEHIEIIGVEGKVIRAPVGQLMCLGRCILLPGCPVSLISCHELEARKFTINYISGIKYEVHVSDELSLHFNKLNGGTMYVCDVAARASELGRVASSIMLSATVSQRLQTYSKREQTGISKVLDLQRSLGYPSRKEIANAIRNGVIIDCPITIDDIQRTEYVYGRSVPELKGKSVKPKNADYNIVKIDKNTDEYQLMYCDIMYINNTSFIVSVIKPMNLLLCSYCDNMRNAKNYGDLIMSHVDILRSQQFIVDKVYIDEERGMIGCKQLLSQNGIELIIAAKGDHVGTAERAIRVIKDRCRCILSELPWRIPVSWTKYIVFYTCNRINALPRLVSGTMCSPRELFRGIKLNYKKDLNLCFGDYVQAYRAPLKSNSMESRTAAAIALYPKDNHTHAWVFMDIITGYTFSSTKWNVLPIPDIVIDRINSFDETMKVERVRADELPPPLIDLRVNGNNIDEIVSDDNGKLDDMVAKRTIVSNSTTMPRLPTDEEIGDDIGETIKQTNHENATTDIASNDHVDNNEQEMGTIYIDGLRRSARVNPILECYNISFKKACQEYGVIARNAVMDEVRQMIDKGVFEIMESDTIPKGVDILNSHIFLKLKSNGILKARLVAGGNTMDRSVYGKDVRSSPTVHLENLLLQIGYAAMNNMSICSMDIEGAYLEADLPEPIYMRLSKDATESLNSLAPATYGRTIVVKLKKALYGLVVSSKLWYDKLKGVLLKLGLTVHHYDSCVFVGVYRNANIILSCYVDDLLLCYDGDNELPNKFVSELKKHFTAVKLDTSNPLVHVGLEISKIPTGYVITMTRYENDLITFVDIGEATVVCPNHADMLDEHDSVLLVAKESKYYHTVVAKLLYLAKRTRPDILTAVSILCGRVLNATEYDLQLAMKVIKYLNGTVGYGLHFDKGQPMDQLLTYCDAAYGIDTEFKSRTGIVVLYAGAPIYAKSSKQAMVTKSSTEAELVALCDGVTIALACRNFILGIGVDMRHCVIYEDNKAVLELIKTEGPFSMRTRHLSVKLFFTKQFVDDGTLKVKYCNTDDMIADVLTKPLTGVKFRTLRDMLISKSQ